MQDRVVVRIVAGALALVVIGAVIAATICAILEKVLPDLVGDLAKVSLGALGGLLANVRSDAAPAPVYLASAPQGPVSGASGAEAA